MSARLAETGRLSATNVALYHAPQNTGRFTMATVDSRLVSQFLHVSTPNVSDALDRPRHRGRPAGHPPDLPVREDLLAPRPR